VVGRDIYQESDYKSSLSVPIAIGRDYKSRTARTAEIIAVIIGDLQLIKNGIKGLNM